MTVFAKLRVTFCFSIVLSAIIYACEFSLISLYTCMYMSIHVYHNDLSEFNKVALKLESFVIGRL